MMFMALDNEADRSKIVRIYKTYRSLMFYTAVKILKDHALAEDAVSDSIEKLIRNLHKVGDVSCYKTKALAVVIVRNTALNILKKSKRTDDLDAKEVEVADSAPLVADKLMSLEGFNSIVEMINALPDIYRDAAVLSMVHEYSHGDIAGMLDISYDTVKMRISRAKKIIRNKLREGR